MADDRNITERLWGLPKAPVRAPRRKPGQRLEREIVKSIERDLNRLPGVHVTRVTVAMVRQNLVQRRGGCYVLATGSPEAIAGVEAFRRKHEAAP